MQKSIKISELAAYNSQPHKAQKFRLPVEAHECFEIGAYVPLVMYNALTGTNGQGLRSVAQRTRARVLSGAIEVDEFDPILFFVGDAQGMLFELVGFLIDAGGKERLTFSLKIQRDK